VGATVIRVIIADDHDLVRQGLVRMFEGSDVEIVAQAADGKTAVELAREHRPDVLLLDVRMPNGDGFEALEGIRTAAPETRVVMFSTYDNPTYIARSLAHGAADYVLKGSSREELLQSLQATARGEPAGGETTRRINGALARNGRFQDAEVSLTQREAQVLRHLTLGLSNREISHVLAVSEETVKEHVQHLLRKIPATDRTQAAVWGVRKGLV
jgi:DNA-binding NarL/FixJ family response regulator